MPRSSRQRAITEADKWFSKYIRLKYAGKDGYVKCYTCPATHRWDSGHKVNCGHFMSRGKYATRWHEDNARPQCVGCNKYKSGQQYIFGQNLNQEREGLAEEMRILSEQIAKYTVDEIRDIAADYRRRFEELLAR